MDELKADLLARKTALKASGAARSFIPRKEMEEERIQHYISDQEKRNNAKKHGLDKSVHDDTSSIEHQKQLKSMNFNNHIPIVSATSVSNTTNSDSNSEKIPVSSTTSNIKPVKTEQKKESNLLTVFIL